MSLSLSCTRQIRNPLHSPNFSAVNPGYIAMNSSVGSYFVSFSPPVIRPPGWTFDEVAITTHIANGASLLLLLLLLMPTPYCRVAA